LGNGSVWKLARSLARIFTQIGLERLFYALNTLPTSQTFQNEAIYPDMMIFFI